MKKLLALLTLMVGFMVFSVGAFAAEGPCTECNTALRNIPCVGGEQSTCGAFDYDANYGYDGYCTSSKTDYRLIFNICDCPTVATDFVAGQIIGVRQTILVNGQPGERGAYWSAGASANVAFQPFAPEDNLCSATTTARHFGTGVFEKYNGTDVTTLEGTSCTVASANQATVIRTDTTAVGGGYTITEDDEDLKLSHWWIDIAPIRIDPSVLHNGEIISVKIELLNQESGGICSDCVSVCECTIDVAKVCCYVEPSSYSLLFPYFTNYVGSDYWNGIVITNVSSVAGTATLKAYEQDGSVGEATVEVGANSMFVSLLENVGWTGTDLGNSPCYVVVTTDFRADGFAMLANDNHDSMGYLPRND